MSLLPTNYQNEVMNQAMSNRRQYRVIQNNNNTISFIDVTVYDREGSLFDADDVNAITEQINLNIQDLLSIHNSIDVGVVNGIKGSAETDYRTGQVSLTAGNLGAYTKAEVDNLISIVGGLHFELVDELPTTDISPAAIYLVPSTSSKKTNMKDEFIYIRIEQFEDITENTDIEDDFASLPVTGTEDIYYITSDDNKIYTWDDTNQQYVEETSLTALFVSSLPQTGQAGDIYILTTDNTVHLWVESYDWEQIGSTAVDLVDYYDKTEIDTGALITASEFNLM